jgi:hypothetical protein
MLLKRRNGSGMGIVFFGECNNRKRTKGNYLELK